MSILTLLIIILFFGALFYFAPQFLSGMTLQLVKFLSGAIIVVALVIFLLGLGGYRVL